MDKILYLIVLSYCIASCSTNSANEGQDTADKHDHSHDHDHSEGDGVHFGSEIDAANSILLGTAIQNIEAGEKTYDLDLGEGNMVKAVGLKVEGKVSEVCQKAGCWLRISSDEGESIFITTNHEFFVPVDIVGKSVVVKGDAFKMLTPVEELRHYAEDEGATAEEIAAITEPEAEYRIQAEGLVIKQ